MSSQVKILFGAPSMPARRYVEENGSAAVLAANRSAGVTPEVNPWKPVTHIPPPSTNKAAHSGFETQRRCHVKSKTGISGPTKRTCVLQFFFTIRNEVAKVMFLDVSVHGGGGVCLSARWDTTPTPREQTAAIADGTHPTGMHSCSFFQVKMLFGR